MATLNAIDSHSHPIGDKNLKKFCERFCKNIFSENTKMEEIMSEELKQQFIEGESDMKAAVFMMCKTVEEVRELMGLVSIQELHEIEKYLF